jgi:plastocyanin
MALAAIAPIALVAGCGSSSSSSANSTTTASVTAPAATAPASTAPATTTPATASTVAVAADPSGALAYVQKSLTASAGKVTFDFTNASPVQHNLTFEVASTEHELGATKTITNGNAAVTLTLPKGKYHYYCSVPGHEAAGMSGILTVS